VLSTSTGWPRGYLVPNRGLNVARLKTATEVVSAEGQVDDVEEHIVEGPTARFR